MKYKNLILLILSITAFVACNDDYYADGGKLDSNVGQLDVSTMNYLISQKGKFDTLVEIIKLTEMETVVDGANNTFMAPQDYSIQNYFKLRFEGLETQPKNLNEIPQDILAEMKEILGYYIIPNEKITTEKLSTTYTYVDTYSKRKARFNVFKTDYLGNKNKGAKILNFSINNLAENGEKGIYRSVIVTTSNLHSTNGIVHILYPNNHIFGFK